MIAIQELTARFDWFDTLGLLIMFNLTKKSKEFDKRAGAVSGANAQNQNTGSSNIDKVEQQLKEKIEKI